MTDSQQGTTSVSLGGKEGLSVVIPGVDSSSAGRLKTPGQVESDLDWSSLTGINEALRSGAIISISSGPEYRFGKLDTSKRIMTVGVLDHETHNIITMGQNSYVEGAIRDADNKLKDPSLSDINSSDEPPTQESLLNWFVRLGGHIMMDRNPQGRINLEFSITGDPLHNMAWDYSDNSGFPWTYQDHYSFGSIPDRLTEGITDFIRRAVIYRSTPAIKPSDVFTSLPSDDGQVNNPPGIDLDQIYQLHQNSLADLPD